MGNVVQLRRPEPVRAEKLRPVIGMFLASFDEMTDLLLTPGLQDELRRKFINDWRKGYGLPSA